METVNNEKSLIERLRRDVKVCGKKNIVLQAGHFPLLYIQQLETAFEGIHHWGAFSLYTLILACNVGVYAQELEKTVEFAFLVDDHSYGTLSGLNRTQKGKRRQNLYELRSGVNAELIEDYKEIMQAHGFSKHNALRQDHGKTGREACLYFSELVLRASEIDVDNACAREYVEFVENIKYFNKKNSHLISFVPQRCKGHICDIALDALIEDLSASHIFMETGIERSEEIYCTGRGVVYRRD